MKLKVFSTTAVFAAASACSFAVNLILARAISPDEYALYGLLYTVFLVIAMLGDAGVTQKYLRFFLKNDVGRFDWPRVIARDLPLPLGLVALCGLASTFVYPQAGAGPLAVAALGSLAYILLQWLTTILRGVSQGPFLAFVQRGFPFGMLAALPLLVATRGHLAWSSAFLLLGISAAFALVAYLLCRRQMPVGTDVLPDEHREDGRSLMILLFTVALLFYGDKLIVARVCSPADFATYNLVAVFYQTFDLLNLSIGFVLAPLYAKKGQQSARLIRIALMGLVPLAVGVTVAVPWVMHALYPHYAALNPWIAVGFAVAGTAKVLNGMVMSDLNLNASTEALRGYVLQNMVVVGVGLAALYGAAQAYGVVGASLMAGGVWTLRTVLALLTEARTRGAREAVSA